MPYLHFEFNANVAFLPSSLMFSAKETPQELEQLTMKLIAFLILNIGNPDTDINEFPLTIISIYYVIY